ncbi:MAG TPA: lipid-A-disaccharide synthase, partial [Terriglobales bacterium]|nr:lipid-A-disaccharide synthase [Terriglobales bacterium]
LAEPAISRAEYARETGLDPEATWIALLPGSRKRAVRVTLPAMAAAATLLQQRSGREYSFLLPIASNLDEGWLRNEIAHSGAFPGPRIVIVKNARPALHQSSAAVVTSGTATVEAALMGCPFVAVYRLSPLTFWAAKRLVKVPFAAMPNLIAGRQIVPEFLQNDFTPERVAAELQALLEDQSKREQMIAGFAEVREKLRSRPGAQQSSAIERAADAVLRALPSSGNR